MTWSWGAAPAALGVRHAGRGCPGTGPDAGSDAGSEAEPRASAEGWEQYEEEGGCIGGSRSATRGTTSAFPSRGRPSWASGSTPTTTSARAVADSCESASTASARPPRSTSRTQARSTVRCPAAGTLPGRRDPHGRRGGGRGHRIRYGGLQAPRARRQWRSYPGESRCIGGDRCREQGSVLRIPLENASLGRPFPRPRQGGSAPAPTCGSESTAAPSPGTSTSKTGENYDLLVRASVAVPDLRGDHQRRGRGGGDRGPVLRTARSLGDAPQVGLLLLGRADRAV